MDERLESRIDEIEEYFERLSEVLENAEGIPREESEENLVRKLASATIDIASRMVALEGGKRPDSYSGYFKELEEKEVIDEQLSKKLQDMARFRNLVVHQYHRISQDEIERIIDEDLHDIKEFIKQVERYYSDRT